MTARISPDSGFWPLPFFSSRFCTPWSEVKDCIPEVDTPLDADTDADNLLNTFLPAKVVAVVAHPLRMDAHAVVTLAIGS